MCEATSQRGLKMSRSVSAWCGIFDLAVSTQKMEGSMWSFEMLPTFTNFSIAYLYGT